MEAEHHDNHNDRVPSNPPSTTSSSAAVPSSSRDSPSSASLMMSPTLSSFLQTLFQENAVLAADVEVVADRAAMLPDRQSKSCRLQSHSSSISSLPELSRWDSHIVRTPPAVAPQREEKNSRHAIPIRPQRRTSFEVDRSHERLLSDDPNRTTFSQSLTQLSTLQEDPLLVQQQQPCKKTLPPRVPIRRSSGRVHSPPPPDAHTRHNATNRDRQEESSNGSFQLDFSESEHHEEDAIYNKAKPQQAPSGAPSASAEDDTTPRRPASYEDRTRRSSLSLPQHQSRSRSPRQAVQTNNRARHTRRSSLTRESKSNPHDTLPQLEGFSKHPPHERQPQLQRVLPRGSLHLSNDLNSVNEDTTELNLTKVASSKVMPAQRAFDVGEKKMAPVGDKKLAPESQSSPTTVQKAVKKTLLGRMKKVKGKRLAAGRSKSPIRRNRSDTSYTLMDDQGNQEGSYYDGH